MKTIRIFTLMLCFATIASAQNNGTGVLNDLVKPFSEGDANALSAYFAPSLDCDVLGKEGVYSKQQATQVIKNFFDGNKPASFSVRHSGGKDVMKYAIYSLTAGGKKYRVTIFVKPEERLIRQLRIENE